MYKSLMKLWPEIKQHKYNIITYMFLAIILSALAPVMPLMLEFLIEDVFKKASTTQLSVTELKEAKLVLLGLPALFLISGITRFYHFYLVKLVSERVIARVRELLINKILDYKLSFHMKSSEGSGGILSKVLNDTNVLQQGLNYYSDIVREPLIALSLIGFMIYTNWKLTLFCLIFAPIFILIIKQVSKSLRKYGYRSQEAMDHLTSAVKENLDGVKIIQSFNLETEMKNRFKKRNDHYVEQRKTIIKREEFVSPLNEFFASILVAIICFYQISLISSGESSTGEFVGFIMAAGLLQKPIKKIQTAFVKIQQNIVVIDRIYGIIEANEEVKEIAQPRPFPVDWKKIEYKNVSFKYDDSYVLKNINLTIDRGQKIAFVGESGSGKSTLVNLLSRFFDPSEGEILVDGISTKEFKLHDLRKHIGLVTQDVFLFNDTLEKNIHYGNLDRNPDEIQTVVRLAKAQEFIEKQNKGLKTMAGERGSFFSGGERQRISIARAMFKDSDILILDEATSALDSASEVSVQQGLDELMKGKTALIIAHRLSTVRNADRILVLKDGQIIEQGSHDSLVANKQEYYNFYQLQMSHSET